MPLLILLQKGIFISRQTKKTQHEYLRIKYFTFPFIFCTPSAPLVLLEIFGVWINAGFLHPDSSLAQVPSAGYSRER